MSMLEKKAIFRLFQLLLAWHVLFFPSVIQAEERLESGINPAEMATLPPYCKARVSPNTAEFESWHKQLGPKFMDIHHYCTGLNYINRYFKSRDNTLRKYYLSRVIPEMNYTMKDLPPAFPLAGEMYLNRGYGHRLSGNKATAMMDFIKAVELGPKRPQAYSRLIDSYLEAKNKAKALEVASSGLAHLPDNKMLQRKYLELGGKEPFPKPVSDPPAKTEAAMQPEAPAVPASSPASMINKPETVASEPVQTEPAKERIGSPSNPFCRFCPTE
jgi:tetratricopeptide (TPR) repeat protein